MNSCQSQSLDEELRCRLKHQISLQEFLQLKKKKKLQIAKKKRDVLLAEIDFLRKRYRHLMDLQSQKFQSKQELVVAEKPCMQKENAGKSFKMVKLTHNKRIKK